ncbi:NAD(P)/FAD-dependent oxidoreductase [Flavobacterium sp. D11R37]|uniref:NAD(P)/FAD-dependent oxidoreductase n=1 Tax=Flavobacterium coralii TaxID=2838017 RepID=UPI001CA7356A|nr:NAD(P)/FAD-dependent oxidoreductase [Flavobacterium coralii]MBY8963381.1 NAD(P)/FAD-dependent oxidoreductase [Flavobacterium coralii]
MENQENFEVIIIGGSYSGLSAAMALGRSLRKVLIIDGGEPCNRQTPHSHNFITQDGTPPAVIAGLGKEQVLQYKTVTFITDVAVSGEKTNSGFSIITKSGKQFTSQKLIFATGIKDIMPYIKGFAECWGISVIHCPYCHGYEVRGKNTAILANGERAYHLATLVSNLTDKLTIITSRKADFTAEQTAKLAKNNIPVIEEEVIEVIHTNGQLQNLVLSCGNALPFDAAYAALPFVQHSDIPAKLGCELTEMGHIKTDGFQKTTVEGVFACGDNAAMMRSVASAVSSGNIAGAVANMELCHQSF